MMYTDMTLGFGQKTPERCSQVGMLTRYVHALRTAGQGNRATSRADISIFKTQPHTLHFIPFYQY